MKIKTFSKKKYPKSRLLINGKIHPIQLENARSAIKEKLPRVKRAFSAVNTKTAARSQSGKTISVMQTLQQATSSL